MSDQILTLLKSSNPNQRKQGIQAAAKQGSPRYLKVLAHVYKTDPDPSVREMAKKAGAQIARRAKQQQAQPTPQPAAPADDLSDLRGQLLGDMPDEPEPAPPPRRAPQQSAAPAERNALVSELMGTAAPAAAPSDNTSAAPPPPPPGASREHAKKHYDFALELHLDGKAARTVMELGTALYYNPDYKRDQAARNIAAQLTGMPAAEAVEYMANPNTWRELTEKHGGLRSGISSASSSLALWIIGGLAGIVVFALLFAFLQSPVFGAALESVFQDTIGGWFSNAAGSILETTPRPDEITPLPNG